MDNKFNYMLLNRLQEDCYCFFSGGCTLWGITPKAHADKMVELWDGLKVKPTWLTIKELKMLYFKLTNEELKI